MLYFNFKIWWMRKDENIILEGSFSAVWKPREWLATDATASIAEALGLCASFPEGSTRSFSSYRM